MVLRVACCVWLLAACSSDPGAVASTHTAAHDGGGAGTVPALPMLPDVSRIVSHDAGSHVDDAGLPPGPPLTVLSSRADMVTDGNALVRLDIESLDGVLVRLRDGADVDVTDHFHPHAGAFVARIEDLPLGKSELIADVDGTRTTLAFDNHPRAGPVFSGPHQAPFACTAAEPFGEPMMSLDAVGDDCSAADKTVYWYRTTTNTFAELGDPSVRPADIAQVMGPDGNTVDFVVRIDLGTRNRAVYWNAVLHDPTQPQWQPWQPQTTWNRKLIYLFGGGCGVGYWQGTPSFQPGQYASLLGQGYALMHASLNTLGHNCNDVLSAETAMMVKERFVEQYGVPLYTMGSGGSGGSIQQHLIADNYPGILDGLMPTMSYPDFWSVLPDIMDCRLLRAVFGGNPLAWTPAARLAVMGYGHEQACVVWDTAFSALFDPGTGCNSRVPTTAIYDAATNPTGARCTLQDHNVNIFGRDPSTGFARRAFDNEGVQYGLAALLDGTLTAQQFLDLNESIGGIGMDGALQPARNRADAEAVARAYSTGRVLDGENLAAVPIVDLRTYLDPAGDIHDAFRTHSTRARLALRNGDTGNHVALIADGNNSTAIWQATLDAIVRMDQWLTALAEDPDPDRVSAVRRTRPADLEDRCYFGATPAPGLCPGQLPLHKSPRLVAGAPLANDIIQCALRPIDPSDYGTRLSGSELSRLASIFSSGVCDWSAPPPNRAPHAGPWQRF